MKYDVINRKRVVKNTVFQTFFKRFFLDFSQKIIKKHLKIRKKVENGPTKVFCPVFGCAQYPKAGQNTH